MTLRPSIAVALILFVVTAMALAQQPDVPQVFRYTYTVPEAQRVDSGTNLNSIVRIYSNDSGGAPIWVEHLQVKPDSNWRLSLLLGSTTGGLPSSLFQTNAARWISVQIDDFEESPRAALISVPYALKARDADTLGGIPASAFLVNLARLGTASDNNSRTTTTGTTTYQYITSGALNVVPKFINSTDLGGSQITDTGLGVGIGTSSPQEMLDLNGRALLRSTSRGPAGLWLGSNDSSSAFLGLNASDPASPFVLSHGGLPRMTLTQAGQIGIGVDAPISALHVKGDIRLSSGSLYFSDGTSLSSAPVIGVGSATIAAGDSSITVGTSNGETTVAVADSGVTSAKIADYSISTAKIADGSVTAAKLAPGAITTSIAAGDSSITIGTSNGEITVAVSDAGVTTAKLADSSVATAKIADGSVTAAKLAPGTMTAPITAGDSSITVTTSNGIKAVAVADSGVTSTKLADYSVSTTKIADGSVTAAKLAPGAISVSGFAGLGSNSFTGDQTVRITNPTMPGISAYNASTTNASVAIFGETSSSTGLAIKAHAAATSGGAVAVYAVNDSTTGYGSYSIANASTGVNYGTYGQSRSSSGIGVMGDATSSAGTTYGVYGQTAGARSSVGVYGIAANSAAPDVHYGVYGQANGIYGIGVIGNASNSALGNGTPIGVLGRTISPLGTGGHFMNLASSGNVVVAQGPSGIVWRVDNTGNQYMNGTVHTGGADFAESIQPQDDSGSLTPGDVLAISETGDRRVQLSDEPYSTRVIGVYATKPGVLASRRGLERSGTEVPVAMVGIVPVKASAENGAIHRGDLLVSAATPGHVMRATDRQRFTGAIVGKAMQGLEAGTGVIEIAVTLQ